MVSIPKLTLAALLATAVTGAADAQQRPAPAATAPAAPRLKLSPAVVKIAKPAQDAVAANNPAVAEPLVAGVEAAAKTPDDLYIAGVFRLGLEQQKQQAARAANPRAAVDNTGMARALDSLIAGPSTPAADRARFAARRGEMAYDGKDYATALRLFEQARTLGNTDDSLTLAIVKTKIDSGDIAGGTADLERVVAAYQARGEKAPEDYYRFAIARTNKAKLSAQTVAWMNRYAAAYPTGQTWYEVLATYGFQQGATATLDNPQKIDLFRLMRASGGLPDQYFYIEYAQKAQTAGLPLEARAVLQEGLANGKIPAGNSEARAMGPELTRAIAAEGNLATLETRANAAADGKLASQTADAYLSAGTWVKAAALYRVALTKGGTDADTMNLRLGIALARAGDKPGAQAAFAAVKGGSRKDIASFWTTWLTTGSTGTATSTRS